MEDGEDDARKSNLAQQLAGALPTQAARRNVLVYRGT